MMNTIAKKVSIISAVVEEYLVTTKYILKNNTNVYTERKFQYDFGKYFIIYAPILFRGLDILVFLRLPVSTITMALTC